MSADQMNAFLLQVSGDPALQRTLRASDPFAASALAATLGFDVTVGDLTQHKARATSWQLTDAELEVVARWQPHDQPHWWQLVWPELEGQ